MKKQMVSLLFLAIIGPAVAWAGTPVANIQVAGNIALPTCTVNAGDDDLLYSFGNISPSIIPQDITYNGLPSLSNSLTVICDAETFLTFKATDNYPNSFILAPGMSSQLESTAFSLVDSTDTTKTIGGISFQWKYVTVDGNTAYISRSNDGKADNGTWAGGSRLVKNATNGWTGTQQVYVPPSELALLPGKSFSAEFINSTDESNGINRTYLYSQSILIDNGVDISNGVNYLGDVVLTFNFGV